jgi:hypothetical protein
VTRSPSLRADPHRRRVPADARRGDRVHPPSRRRDRRLERPVRRRPRDRPPGRDRDEPARVAIVGARVEGDRVPDRQDRRQARGRLHPRRDPQRHHASHAAEVADAAGVPTGCSPLRHPRFEPTIDYVVTKIPRWAFEKLPGTSGVLGTQMQSVGEAMSIGRTFPESLQKGLRSLEQGRMGLNCDPAAEHHAARTDDDLLADIERGTPDRIFLIGELLRRAWCRSRRSTTHCKVDPWFLDQMSIVVEEQAELAATGFDGMTRRTWRRAKRLGFADAQLAHLWGVSEDRRAQRPRSSRGPAHLQDRRHLFGRVRRRDALPLLDVRGRERDPPVRPAEGGHPRLGSEPDRPGHRVRLLLRARQLRVARGRLRDGHGQLQPRDRLDRLRHQRPAVLRAAHQGRRPQRHRRRAAAQGDRVARGQTPLKLSGEIPVELVAGTSAQSIDDAEDREKWNLCARAEHPPAARRYGGRPGAGAGDHRRDRLSRCWSVRATCSVVGRCRSCTTATTWRGRWTS